MILLPRARLVRLVSTLLLAFQAATVGVLPLLDSSASSEAPVAAHWEDAADTSCPPEHDAAACRTCLLPGADRMPESSRAVDLFAGARLRLTPVAEGRTPASDARQGSHAPRAPPGV